MHPRAIFLDRDGTLVHLRHFPARPAELVLYRGIDIALRLLQSAGFQLIVITNQPGIALGRFSEADLQAMHQHLQDELARVAVRLDGIYYCPHHPEGSLPEWALRCDCRKPQPGLLQRAAADHHIDLQRSWFLGDILDDIEAGNRAGCRTVLIDLGTEAPPRTALRRPDYVGRDTVHALDIVLAAEQLGPAPEMRYVPESWRQRQRTHHGSHQPRPSP